MTNLPPLAIQSTDPLEPNPHRVKSIVYLQGQIGRRDNTPIHRHNFQGDDCLEYEQGWKDLDGLLDRGGGIGETQAHREQAYLVIPTPLSGSPCVRSGEVEFDKVTAVNMAVARGHFGGCEYSIFTVDVIVTGQLTRRGEA